MAKEKSLLEKLNIAIERASKPETQVAKPRNYMQYDDTEERVMRKTQKDISDAEKKEKEEKSLQPLIDEEDIEFREIKGQREFDKDLPGDFMDMGRKTGMDETALKTFGGLVQEDKAPIKPMGNASTEIGSDTKDPYRVSAKDPEVPGADFSEGLKPTGNALSVEPVEDAKAPTKPMGNVSTDLLSGDDIARRADVPEDTLAALFKKTHGGPFDPKSKMDKAKMATITSMIEENRDLLDLSPTQFALKVYARKK